MTAQSKPAADSLSILHQVENEECSAVFKISSDKLKLFLECRAKPSAVGSIGLESIVSLIPANISRRFLHEDVLNDVVKHLNKGEDIKERRIAKALPCGDPRPGRLLLLVKAYNKKANSSECIDPWFIKHFDNIECGCTVARLYAPQAGHSGIDLFGETIPSSPGKPFEIKLDESLKLEAVENHDFQSIVSERAGYLEAQGGSLKVVSTLVIDGDVDQRIGDIDFIGSVIVKGNVMKDFRIVARGTIEVQGNVVGSSLTSTSGDIIVKGHVAGSANQNTLITENVGLQQVKRSSDSHSPSIRTAGTFRAAAVDSVVVDAAGDIEILKDTRSSYLHTRGLFRSPQGSLIGGEVHSACGAEAKYYGSPSGVTTVIYLASDIESSPEYVKLLESIREHESAEELISLYLGPYAENPARIQLLKPDHRKKMEALRIKIAQIQKSRQALSEERELLLRSAKHNRIYRVNILKHAYAGVRVASGEVMFSVDAAIDGPQTIEFLPSEQKFMLKDLQPLECSLEDIGVQPSNPSSLVGAANIGAIRKEAVKPSLTTEPPKQKTA